MAGRAGKRWKNGMIAMSLLAASLVLSSLLALSVSFSAAHNTTRTACRGLVFAHGEEGTYPLASLVSLSMLPRGGHSPSNLRLISSLPYNVQLSLMMCVIAVGKIH